MPASNPFAPECPIRVRRLDQRQAGGGTSRSRTRWGGAGAIRYAVIECLEAVGQHLAPDRAVLECRVVERDQWCRRCGAEGVPRDTVTRELAHEPFGHRPTTLVIRVRRYRCSGCGRIWRQDTRRRPRRGRRSPMADWAGRFTGS